MTNDIGGEATVQFFLERFQNIEDQDTVTRRDE